MHIKRQRPGHITAERAEEIAVGALLFLAGDSLRIGRFLTESGLDAATLHERAGEPEMLLAVLSYVVADESALLAFAANAGLPPEDVVRAEAILGGGNTWLST